MDTAATREVIEAAWKLQILLAAPCNLISYNASLQKSGPHSIMENRLDAGLYGMPIPPASMPLNASPGLLPNHPLPRPRIATASTRPPTLQRTPASGSQPKRARKDRGPNWLPTEVMTLISVKKTMFFEELDIVDGRDLMTPDASKWLRVSHEIMRANISPCMRDGPACKTKWNQLIPEYKRIADYMCRTGRNSPDYWDLSAAERKAEGLPRLFTEDIFHAIHEWFGSRPQIQPPHVRDLLATNDKNYEPHESRLVHEEPVSEEDTDDIMDLANAENSQHQNSGAMSQNSPLNSSTPSMGVAAQNPPPTPVLRSLNVLPAGVTPHLISSSSTSQFTVNRRTGNTGIRRKNVSGHAVIANATKATGEIMSQQMQDIAQASRDLERSKIDVQLKLFSEQMEYQREKDRRMYDNAVIANENARLAILKQGEMVSCLAHLSSVLNEGLSVKNKPMSPKMPHPTSRDGPFFATTSYEVQEATSFGQRGPPRTSLPSTNIAARLFQESGAPSTSLDQNKST